MAQKSDLWRSRRDLAEAANGIRYDLQRMRTQPPNATPSRWQNLWPSLGAAVASTATYLLIAYFLAPPVGSLAMKSEQDTLKLLAVSTTAGLLVRALLRRTPTPGPMRFPHIPLPHLRLAFVLYALAMGGMIGSDQIPALVDADDEHTKGHHRAAVPAPRRRPADLAIVTVTEPTPVMGIAPAQTHVTMSTMPEPDPAPVAPVAPVTPPSTAAPPSTPVALMTESESRQEPAATCSKCRPRAPAPD